MATSNNTIKTRIQLKSDTEANWNKAGPKEGSNGFVPLSGELIVYAPDATHPFSRLKVGNGITNVVNLPFIDASSINGIDFESEIIKLNNFQSFPSPGQINKLYLDLSTNKMYYYDSNGYTLLPFSITTIKQVNGLVPGTQTQAVIENNTFKIIPGELPQLIIPNELEVFIKR